MARIIFRVSKLPNQIKKLSGREFNYSLSFFCSIIFLQMTITTPSDLRDRVMDNLEDYSKEQIILGLVKFLNQAQLEELKDSLDREIF